MSRLQSLLDKSLKTVIVMAFRASNLFAPYYNRAVRRLRDLIFNAFSNFFSYFSGTWSAFVC